MKELCFKAKPNRTIDSQRQCMQRFNVDLDTIKNIIILLKDMEKKTSLKGYPIKSYRIRIESCLQMTNSNYSECFYLFNDLVKSIGTNKILISSSNSTIKDNTFAIINAYDLALKAKNITNVRKLYLENRNELGQDGIESLKRRAIDGDDNYRVLDINNWSLLANEAFIQGGIDIGCRFKFKTNKLKRDDIQLIKLCKSGNEFIEKIKVQKNVSDILYDPNQLNEDFKIRVLAREIAQLKDAGYVFWEVESKQGEYSLQALPDLSTAQKYYESKSFVTD